MKQQRLRIKLLALILFAMFLLLGAYCVFNVLNNGNRWFSSRWNSRIETQKEAVTAGDILDRAGNVLATTDETGTRVYALDPEIRKSVAHVVGDEGRRIAYGVETFQTSYLYGFRSSMLQMMTDLISGRQRRGDNVQLTIDSELNAAIVRMLENEPKTAGRNGAAVVLNWKTGETLALVSVPVFDPNELSMLSNSSDAEQILLNRATEKLYTPGSILQTISAAAAIDELPDARGNVYTCSGYLQIDGNTIGETGGAVHQQVNLKQAYTRSCNTMFADLAEKLGGDRLKNKAEAFGFNDHLLFRDLVVADSSFPALKIAYNLAAAGIGQAQVLATPMHMCLIAASVANDGMMMEPRLLLSVHEPSGQLSAGYQAQEYRRVCSAETASLLTEYMRSVIVDGSGSRANVNGAVICGKTGQAQTMQNGLDCTLGWFIGFNDDENAPFAVCVVIEDIPNGSSGGTTAAPIAAGIFEWLREHPQRVSDATPETPWYMKVSDVMSGVYRYFTSTGEKQTTTEQLDIGE